MSTVDENQIKTIGRMNGWWAFALKLQLAAFPFVVTGAIAWGTWVTSAVFKLDPDTPRYSYADAAREHALLWEKVDARLDALPPNDWRTRIIRMEETIDQVQKNQIKIILQLDQLKP